MFISLQMFVYSRRMKNWFDKVSCKLSFLHIRQTWVISESTINERQLIISMSFTKWNRECGCRVVNCCHIFVPVFCNKHTGSWGNIISWKRSNHLLIFQQSFYFYNFFIFRKPNMSKGNKFQYKILTLNNQMTFKPGVFKQTLIHTEKYNYFLFTNKI